MQQTDATTSGWEFVASTEAAAPLIQAALELDADAELTRSDFAAAADVPMKRLYLDDTISELVELDVLEPVETESEPVYTVNEDSDVLAAAARFEKTVTVQLAAD